MKADMTIEYNFDLAKAMEVNNISDEELADAVDIDKSMVEWLKDGSLKEFKPGELLQKRILEYIESKHLKLNKNK